MLWILKFLPQNYISTLAGIVMHWRLPGPLKNLSIKVFASMYSINLDEAEKPLDQYLSIGDFFVRQLKAGIRPLAASQIVHCADAFLSASGLIEQGKVFQVKNRPYSLEQMLASTERAKELEAGFFMTYYLCPTDYHRVHSPVSGKIISVTHVPGKLWPVKQKFIEEIPDLFVQNERIVVSIQTDFGTVSVVFVGALNVGQIELKFDPEFRSQDTKVHEIRHQQYEQSIPIQAGAELGMFHMGSTVVNFFPKAWNSAVSPEHLQSITGFAVKVCSAASLR